MHESLEYQLSKRVYTSVASTLKHKNPLILVACSGGPDSTALLLLIHALMARFSFRLHVVYVDHQLRPEAKQEAQHVIKMAQSLGLTAESCSVDVELDSGLGLMAAARKARYEALQKIAMHHNADALVTGHTLDDQAETVLMRLLKGSGLQGLAGIATRRKWFTHQDRNVWLIRPLLKISRSEIEQFLQDKKIIACHDVTNTKTHYFRNRMRHKILPALKEENPHLTSQMSRLSDELRSVSTWLDQQARNHLQRISNNNSPQLSGLIIPDFNRLPQPIKTRILQLASPVKLTQQKLKQILALCQSTSGTKCLTLNKQWQAQRRYKQLYFEKTKVDTEFTHEVVIEKPGIYTLKNIKISITQGAIPEKKSRHIALFNSLCFPLTLRVIRPGDRMWIRGMQGHRKISDILIDEKVAKNERPNCVVLCQGEEILWLINHRPSEIQKPGSIDKDVWIVAVVESLEPDTCSKSIRFLTEKANLLLY